MILTYYSGNNFGDALNPIVFNHYLPYFFDNDPSIMFLGIGSILGFLKPIPTTKKVIVFSSGYAYDDIPLLDSRYDVRCVRGPLTAKALKINENLAVADGAILLGRMPEFTAAVKKKYRFSYVPHYKSEKMYDRWNELLNPLGINFISPAQDPVKIIQLIQESECVLAEAMHAAILADTFRVPWIPIRMFKHINAFKWEDWLLSMNINSYSPNSVKRLYNLEWIQRVFLDKLGIKETNTINKSLSHTYQFIQQSILEDIFRDRMNIIIKSEPFLSNEQMLGNKQNQLLELLDKVKDDYT